MKSEIKTVIEVTEIIENGKVLNNSVKILGSQTIRLKPSEVPKGYELIKSYPGCEKEIGTFVFYTTGYYSNFPEFWKPVY